MLRYKEIKQMLMDLVMKMREGEKLPPRLALCKRFDTSRMTLDKAIAEMEKEGVLYSIKGSGTFVNALMKETLPVAENWAIIVPNVMIRVYVGIVRAIENFAQEKGINIVLCNSDENIDKEESYIRRLMASSVSGFIMIPVICEDIFLNQRIYGRLIDAKIPFVVCCRTIPGIQVPVVCTHNYYGGYLATQELIRRGYRHIAYIAPSKYVVSVERYEGYVSALMEAGIPVNRRIQVVGCPEDGDMGYRAMSRLLVSGEKIDAVFGLNDATCVDLYKAIGDAGLLVSQDIGVIGFDNVENCDFMHPPLSSVAYQSMDVGSKAAEILWDLSRGNRLESDFEYYFVKPELVVRESCLGKSGSLASRFYEIPPRKGRDK